ncbi:MAG TPA: hypothetical protein VN809_13900 [Telmatospirillum sp.]|nr:hypothetical protein [Telmatospirillum sp.]
MRTFITALGMATLLVTTPCLAAGSGKPADTVSSANAVTAAPTREDNRDQLKAKFKDQWDKLKLTQKDQREKLKADHKDQRDKLKADQKQQRDKLKIAQHDEIRKFNDRQAAADDTSAPREKPVGGSALR